MGDRVKFFKNPIRAITLFIIVIFNKLQELLLLIFKNILPILVILALIIVPRFIEGPHLEVSMKKIRKADHSVVYQGYR